MSCKVVLVAVVLLLAVLYKPVIQSVMQDRGKAARDPAVGTVDVMSDQELAKFYNGKRVLIVGGTRGVGFGTALAIVRAGAHVTIVGRKIGSALDYLTAAAAAGRNPSPPRYMHGDLETVASTQQLLASLATLGAKEGLFDYLVCTVAVFPQWDNLYQEDGLEKGFAIAVVGRHLLYRAAASFMKMDASTRFLNVAASGNLPYPFDRELAAAKRAPTGLIEGIMVWSNGIEMDQIGLQDFYDKRAPAPTRVTTFPGLLATDLHRGQGALFDAFEALAVKLMGISEEDCGMQQASILASPKLHAGQLTTVDGDMVGRVTSPELREMVKEHQEWLYKLIDAAVQGQLASFKQSF